MTQVQAAGEGVDVEADGAGGRNPLRSRPVLPGSGTRRAAKSRIWLARALISWQSASMRACVSCWPPVRRSGLVSRNRVAWRGQQVQPVAVGSALVDVADQEVGAAGVAALPDLAKVLLDGGAWLSCPPLAEVVAVGVDESGLVPRDALQPFGLAGPVVALDRVQGQAQAAGALQQARALSPAGRGPAASGPGSSWLACPPAWACPGSSRRSAPGPPSGRLAEGRVGFGPGRPARRPARCTRRTALTSPGAPRALSAGVSRVLGPAGGPRGRYAAAAVAVAGNRHGGRAGEPDPMLHVIQGERVGVIGGEHVRDMRTPSGGAGRVLVFRVMTSATAARAAAARLLTVRGLPQRAS